MPRRSKTEVAEMWINPRSNLTGHIVWDRRKTDAWNARYLQLGDVALTAKTTQPQEASFSFVPPDNRSARVSNRQEFLPLKRAVSLFPAGKHRRVGDNADKRRRNQRKRSTSQQP